MPSEEEVGSLQQGLKEYAKWPHPSSFVKFHSVVFGCLQRNEHAKLEEILCKEIVCQVQRLADCLRKCPSGSLKTWMEITALEIAEIRNCMYCLQAGGRPLHNKLTEVLAHASLIAATWDAWQDARVGEHSEQFWSRVVDAIAKERCIAEVEQALLALVDVWTRSRCEMTALCVQLPEIEEKPVAALRATCVKMLAPENRMVPAGFGSSVPYTSRVFHADRKLIVQYIVRFLSAGDLVHIFGLDRNNYSPYKLFCKHIGAATTRSPEVVEEGMNCRENASCTHVVGVHQGSDHSPPELVKRRRLRFKQSL